ncbi:MAG: hypothetical protein JXJ19_07270 [Elusimicrobia bacterium]|nr:hypothetical protein [Elusimicrobiota bacterium]
MKRIIPVLLILAVLLYGIPSAEITPIKGSFSVSLQKSEPKKTSLLSGLMSFMVAKQAVPYEHFEVSINYTDYYFVTDEGLPGYYIGLPMTCEVVIKNGGDRDMDGLVITMVHEYYRSGICERTWCPPYPVEYEKGSQLPGDSAMAWPGISIKKGETVILPFEYTPPYETCSGLDQTHVIIENSEDNTVIQLYNNSEAGVYCPPPPD